MIKLKSPLSHETYSKNAGLYKILANAKRLEILNVLKVEETGVSHLLKLTKLSKANLSQHLALMRHAGLVTTRRDGLNIFYSIVDSRIVESCKILHQLRTKHIID
jgi:ArsR family transcriptional regulator